MTRALIQSLVAMFALLVATPNLTAAPNVLVSIAPIHSIVVAVMKGVGVPQLLIDKSVSPHELSLRPSQARALQKADLVVWIGEAMETPLQKPILVLAKNSLVLTLLEALEIADNVDPHIWLDPQKAQKIANVVAEKLVEIDPANGAVYLDNARLFGDNAQLLEVKIGKLLKGIENRPFIATHAAYDHFVGRFDLNSVGRRQGNQAVQPGAWSRDLLRKQAVANNVGCLVVEYGEDNRQLIESMGNIFSKFTALDLLGAKQTPGQDLYPELMENLAIDLAECLN